MKKIFKFILIMLVIFWWPLSIIPLWFTKWSTKLKIFLTLPIIPFLFTGIYFYIAQPYKVAGASMHPTLRDQEYFMLNKLDKVRERGEVVVYQNPEDSSQDFIGRIIGIPGDTVELKDSTVYINGKKSDEPYTNGAPTNVLEPRYGKITLDSDEYYLLGDNRERSADSRLRGPIKADKINGSYWFTYKSVE